MAVYKAVIETDEPLGQFVETQIEQFLEGTDKKAQSVSVKLTEEKE